MSGEASFTPGPWHQTTADPLHVESYKDGWSIATADPDCGANDGPRTPISDRAESIANARLIAAAPDLYAELSALAENLSINMGAKRRGRLKALLARAAPPAARTPEAA